MALHHAAFIGVDVINLEPLQTIGPIFTDCIPTKHGQQHSTLQELQCTWGQEMKITGIRIRRATGIGLHSKVDCSKNELELEFKSMFGIVSASH